MPLALRRESSPCPRLPRGESKSLPSPHERCGYTVGRASTSIEYMGEVSRDRSWVKLFLPCCISTAVITATVPTGSQADVTGDALRLEQVSTPETCGVYFDWHPSRHHADRAKPTVPSAPNKGFDPQEISLPLHLHDSREVYRRLSDVQGILTQLVFSIRRDGARLAGSEVRLGGGIRSREGLTPGPPCAQTDRRDIPLYLLVQLDERPGGPKILLVENSEACPLGKSVHHPVCSRLPW